MPNEIRGMFQLTIQKDAFLDSFALPQMMVDMAEIGAHRPIVTVGFAAEEDIPIGDVPIGELGLCVMRSMEPTGGNFVRWGPSSGGVMIPVGRITPNEFSFFRIEPGVTMRWQANTADVRVELRIYRN